MTTPTRFRRSLAVAATGTALAALLAGCASKASNTSAQSGPSGSSGSSSAPSQGSGSGSTGSSMTGSAGTSGSASTTGGSAGSAPSGCGNLAATQAVKDAVTAAYKKQTPVLVHIVTTPGTFYYGQCQGTKYVASYFSLTAGATLPEQVAHQDDGAAMQFFSTDASGTWHWLTSEGFPPAPKGCAAISQIPAPLAAIWGDCSAHPTY